MTDILSPSPWTAVQETREERLHARIAGLEEALRPYVQFADRVEEKYRKHGGNPDTFPDTHPFADIRANEIPTGVWRNARAALAKGKP
jgi:hypothetical protein